jgi:hypothetical protein
VAGIELKGDKRRDVSPQEGAPEDERFAEDSLSAVKQGYDSLRRWVVRSSSHAIT